MYVASRLSPLCSYFSELHKLRSGSSAPSLGPEVAVKRNRDSRLGRGRSKGGRGRSKKGRGRSKEGRGRSKGGREKEGEGGQRKEESGQMEGGRVRI